MNLMRRCIFFGSIGKFFSNIFREISRFVSRLLKDPIGLVMGVISVVMAVMTFGSLTGIAIEMWHLYLAAGLELFAVGADAQWLETAIAIAVLVINIAGCMTDWQSVLTKWQEAISNLNPAEFVKIANYGRMRDTAMGWANIITWLDELTSGMGRLILVGVNAFMTATTLVSIRDDATYVTAAATTADEFGELVGGVAGEVIGGATGGFIDAITGSGSSKWLLIGAALIGGYLLLTADDDSTGEDVQIYNERRASAQTDFDVSYA